MREKITQPGMYDIPMEEYLADPCAAPSLSSSEARILIEKTPAHLRQSKLEERTRARKADIGTAIHALVLEPLRAESAIAVIDAANFQTKAARAAADAALAQGKTVLLAADYEKALKAVEAIHQHPVASQLVLEGEAEKTWIAKDKRTGMMVRARIDLFTPKRAIVEIKSVASCDPQFLSRRVHDGGWFQQAPFHCHVVERLQRDPVNAFFWVCVEQEPPHAVVVRTPAEATLIHGARLNDTALDIFARCVKANRWDAYPPEIDDLGIPDYAYYRLEQEAVKEDGTKDMRAAKLGRELNAHALS